MNPPLEGHELVVTGWGALKLAVRQKGPYVLQEVIERENIMHHLHSSSVMYQTQRYWHDQPDQLP